MNEAAAPAIMRLHPSLRYVIASNLGWRGLRPIQEDAIPPVLSGATTLILAPTAGGKTEAAILPLFSRILDEQWAPTSILYLAPLRALLNDLGERLGELAGHLGLTVGVWHGDVGQRERRRIASAPPDVLLTTPESLEVMLSLASSERRALLLGLRVVVVDEVHAFYGIDRGTQLLALLERLQFWGEHDVQRIGLSATIGNPADLVTWLQGSSERPTSLVRVARSAERTEAFELRYQTRLSGVVADIAQFEREKIIAFCRTRSDVEELAHALERSGRPAWAHHSALSRENREDAERAFREAREGVLVATSTLELGIDIGDLDRVVQVDAPTTVASLVQRLGRTGRRGGEAAMTFIATNPEQLTLVAALLALHAKGWIEPIVPPWRPFPVLAQQILATVLQSGGVGRSVLTDQLARNAAFSRITRDEIDGLLDYFIAESVLELADGALTFGLVGERRFGYRNFMELTSVFQSTESVLVRSGGRDVGTLDRWFIEEMLARDRSTFLLNGRAWNVERWPEADAVVDVVAASSADAPLFLGAGLVLSWDVMQSVRRILADQGRLEDLMPPRTLVASEAAQALDELRLVSAPQRLERASNPLIKNGRLWQLYTYAGVRANRLICDLVFEPLALAATVTNTAIKFRVNALDVEALRSRIAVLSANDTGSLLADRKERPAVNAKFADLLSEVALRLFSQERAYDTDGALLAARAGIHVVEQAANATH